MGRRAYSTGSCLQNFCTVSSALGQINAKGKHRNKIQWNIHGLKFQDMRTIEKYTEPNTLRISPLSAASCVEKLTWQSCQAYIDPDIDAESVNYLALSALWLGVPTIVSKNSATGKFLQQIPCAEKPLVELSGDTATDIGILREKLYKDILNEDARPTEWAKEISEYFHNNPELFELDLAVLSSRERQLSGSSNRSYITAWEQPDPDVVAKVQPWLQGTQHAWNSSINSKVRLAILLINAKKQRNYKSNSNLGNLDR